MAKSKGGISSLGTVGAFLNGRACSDTLLHVLNCAFDRPMGSEEHAAVPLAGGIMQHGHQCGMIWWATLAIDFLARVLRLKPGQLLQPKGLWRFSGLATTQSIAAI